MVFFIKNIHIFFVEDFFFYLVISLFFCLDGRIYVLPLSMLENERQNPLCRRDCSNFYLKKSKGNAIIH